MINCSLTISIRISGYSLDKSGATKACLAMTGWSVKWTSPKSLVCTKGGTSSGSDCNRCDTWRLLVWSDGGRDQAHGGQTYQTKAGKTYSGHNPCKTGWNLRHCPETWAPKGWNSSKLHFFRITHWLMIILL